MINNKSPKEVRVSFIDAFPEGSGELAYWIWNHIASLHLNWAYFTRLFATDEASIQLMNKVAPSFFSMVYRSLRTDNLLRICRLTDPSFSNYQQTMENASLSRLIDRTAESISAGVLKETKLLMTQLDEQSQHIRKLRNKRLAHSDYSEVLRLHNEPLPGIGTQQIEDIIAKITKIFSLLEGQFLESETVFRGTTPSQPATSILWALRKSLKYNDIEKLVLTGQFGLTND